MISRRSAASLIALSAVALTGCGVLLDGRASRRERAAEANYPPEGAFVEVAGRRVHYVQRGAGPDLVLIHGANGSTRDFTFSFMDRLTGRYRVTAFDRPGLGFTDRISDAFSGSYNTAAESLRQQAAFLAAAGSELGLRRPLVLGHSYGGAVALAWALGQPLSGLIVVSGVSNAWEGGLDLLYDINASALGGAGFVPVLTAFAPRARAKSVIASIFAPQDAPDGYADHVGVGLSLRRETLRANARQVTNLLGQVNEMTPDYGTIGVPTEIIHGTADTIVPTTIHSDRLVTQVPGAALERLDGVGHMPHHVAPARVEAAIDRAAARAGLR